MAIINDSIHDHCSHKTGYMVQWNDSDKMESGWTRHNSFKGALKSQSVNGGSIYKILGDDCSQKIQA